MIEEIIKKYGEKLKAMQAHAKSLNVFLHMQVAALKGDAVFTEGIEYIAARLPVCYEGKNKGERVQSFLISQTFVSLMSEFELFLVEVMSEIIKKYPQKLGAESFKLSEIIEIGSIEEITRIAAERYVNTIMYKRASEYRKSLAEILSADSGFLEEIWPKYVERKARRDIGVHNGWRINDVYRRKLTEVGLSVPFDDFITPTNEYFWETLVLLSDLSNKISEHCTKKFG